jgi:hypothetical protein
MLQLWCLKWHLHLNCSQHSHSNENAFFSSAILQWFVQPIVASNAVRGSTPILIDEAQVESRAEMVPMKCLDENVALASVRRYFTFEAWSLVEQVVETLRSKGKWSCATCFQDAEISGCVCCDSCLDWFHLKCVNKKAPPKTKFWFCGACHRIDWLQLDSGWTE